MLWVFLAGEGPNELGRHPKAEAAVEEPDGAIAALLRRLRSDDWQVIGARRWKDIRQYESKRRDGNGWRPNSEEKRVLGIVLAAVEANADVVAFIRDEDTDTTRRASIENAIERAKEIFPQVAQRIAGGTADPTLDAWTLVLAGHHQAQSWSKAKVKAEAESRGFHGLGSTIKITETIENADLGVVPHGTQFKVWIERAEKALARPDPSHDEDG